MGNQYLLIIVKYMFMVIIKEIGLFVVLLCYFFFFFFFVCYNASIH